MDIILPRHTALFGCLIFMTPISIPHTKAAPYHHLYRSAYHWNCTFDVPLFVPHSWFLNHTISLRYFALAASAAINNLTIALGKLDIEPVDVSRWVKILLMLQTARVYLNSPVIHTHRTNINRNRNIGLVVWHESAAKRSQPMSPNVCGFVCGLDYLLYIFVCSYWLVRHETSISGGQPLECYADSLNRTNLWCVVYFYKFGTSWVLDVVHVFDLKHNAIKACPSVTHVLFCSTKPGSAESGVCGCSRLSQDIESVTRVVIKLKRARRILLWMY